MYVRVETTYEVTCSTFWSNVYLKTANYFTASYVGFPKTPVTQLLFFTFEDYGFYGKLITARLLELKHNFDRKGLMTLK
jgi:hypothetical protein